MTSPYIEHDLPSSPPPPPPPLEVDIPIIPLSPMSTPIKNELDLNHSMDSHGGHEGPRSNVSILSSRTDESEDDHKRRVSKVSIN